MNFDCTQWQHHKNWQKWFLRNTITTPTLFDKYYGPVFSYSSMKSTSRLFFFFFQKVLLCIVRGLYCMKIMEINTFETLLFEKVVLFFTSQLSCSDPFPSSEEKRNTFTAPFTITIQGHPTDLFLKISVLLESG